LSPTDNAIRLSGVQFSYSNKVEVLNIPTFEIKRGEKVFLFGPSGSGKTTLLETLALVLAPDKGNVEILGRNTNNFSISERDQFRAEHLGYIFQMFNLVPYLNVRQNIELPLNLNKARQARAEGQSIEHICNRLGIEKLLEKKVTELSVGQQQRVAVARALMGKPEIILADEPTSALDHDHREKFIELLFELASENNTAVLFVSHDRSLEKLFERSVSLQDINRVQP
jgi:putative ABC transport system ATP-binding protein